MKNTITLVVSALLAVSVLGQANYTGDCAGCFAAGYVYNSDQTCTATTLTSLNPYSLNNVNYCLSSSYSNSSGVFTYTYVSGALTQLCGGVGCPAANSFADNQQTVPMTANQNIYFSIFYTNADDLTSTMTFSFSSPSDYIQVY